MSKRGWGDVLAGVFLLAIVVLLVRPASLGPGFITALGEAMTALVSYVADPQQAGAPATASPGTVYA
jgi:hypothetical protein